HSIPLSGARSTYNSLSYSQAQMCPTFADGLQLALLGGGYAVEVRDSSAATRLVPVEVGVYADGWVEVTGPGLEADAEVVVPR
ncbi:MAG: hypothetical protein CL694_06325, partial [Chloroflexi bacterium]|nr:hypothetical protein [Chloroflexota bacterium]